MKLNNLTIAPKLGILVGVTLFGLCAAGVLASYLMEQEMLNARIDPAVLAWLVTQFPTSPLPTMLQPLTSGQLEKFRDLLAESFRRSALGT